MPRSFLIANKRYGRRLDRRVSNERVATGQCGDIRGDTCGDTRGDTCVLESPTANVEKETPERDEITTHPELDQPAVAPVRTSVHISPNFSLPSVSTPSPPSIVKNLSSNFCTESYPIGWCRDEFYAHAHSFRTMLPTDAHLFPHSLHHTFLPSHTSDINFNRLNDLVDRVFDGLRVCDIYTCTTCGKQYSTPSNLARHKQIHRDMNDKKARKCPHCEKIYVSMPAFSMHVRTHNEGCGCPYCGKRFSRPWLLQGHIRTHTGEKPFKCNLCTKAFADKSNLRAHVQTHSAEKPFVCGRCGKAFALKSYLSKHEESSCMKGLKYHKLPCAFDQRDS